MKQGNIDIDDFHGFTEQDVAEATKFGETRILKLQEDIWPNGAPTTIPEVSNGETIVLSSSLGYKRLQ